MSTGPFSVHPIWVGYDAFAVIDGNRKYLTGLCGEIVSYPTAQEAHGAKARAEQQREHKLIATLRTALQDRRTLAPDTAAENELIDAISTVHDLLVACELSREILAPLALHERRPCSPVPSKRALRALNKAMRAAS